MSTQKQAEANRANAQHSTGPRTADGKSRSSMNALKSGIHAQSMVLPGENAAELTFLIGEYHEYHNPRRPETRALCDKLARGEWLGRRFSNLEAQLIDYEIKMLYKPRDGCILGQAFKNCSPQLSRLQRRIDSTDREFHRDLKMLRLLEAEEDAAESAAAEEQTPPTPDLSTPQPTETADQTPQMASFGQPPDSRAPAPGPRPPAPVLMGSFRQNGVSYPAPMLPGHPDRLQDCPNCRNLGYLNSNCHYVLKKVS